MHQLFMFPRQSSEEQRGIGTLRRGERLLHRLLEMVGLALDEPRFSLQSRAFFAKALLDDVLYRGSDLHEVCRRHEFGFNRLSAHRYATFPVLGIVTVLTD